MNQADDRGFCVLFHRKGRDPESVDAKSHDEAIGIVRGRFPDAKIGHAEDLTEGGDRTLCWVSADAAAADFDGSNAIAEIRRPSTVTFSREALGDIAKIIEKHPKKADVFGRLAKDLAANPTPRRDTNKACRLFMDGESDAALQKAKSFSGCFGRLDHFAGRPGPGVVVNEQTIDVAGIGLMMFRKGRSAQLTLAGLNVADLQRLGVDPTAKHYEKQFAALLHGPRRWWLLGLRSPAFWLHEIQWDGEQWVVTFGRKVERFHFRCQTIGGADW